MNINFYLTNNYEQKTRLRLPAKQSQSNPIKAKQSQFKTQLNPIQTQFQTRRPERLALSAPRLLDYEHNQP